MFSSIDSRSAHYDTVLPPSIPALFTSSAKPAEPELRYIVPCEKHIKKDCDFDKQLTKIDNTVITLKPKNDLDICVKQHWNFPEISFTVKELRQHLEDDLKSEIWLVGGAANPACIPYSDIDFCLYIPNPDYPRIDRSIINFIRDKLSRKASSHPHYFPLFEWAFYKVFYTGRSIFKDGSGAFYGLQDIQIKISASKKYHCVSPSDGAQVSLSRRRLRFATGTKFATTDTEFHEALKCCRTKDYVVLETEGHRDLIFRLNFKSTTGHKVKPALFDIAAKQLPVQLQTELKEKASLTFNRQIKAIPKHQPAFAALPQIITIDLLATK